MHSSKNLIDFPLIILDFDGVCTNCIDAIGSYLTHDISHYGISETSFMNLRHLIDITHAKVVISSNWRNFTTDPSLLTSYWFHPKVGKILNPIVSLKQYLGESLYDMFPPVRYKTKSEVFELWLSNNQIDINKLKYVIFDDDVSEGFSSSRFKDHYIKTNYQTGLTHNDIVTAISILKL